MPKKPTYEEIERRIKELEKGESECKREMEDLREQLGNLMTLMDDSLDGLAIIDQTHKVRQANRRFTQMLGYTIDELLRLHTWDWEVQMNEKEIRESFADLSKTQTTFETRHRRKDGTIYDAEVTACRAKLGEEIMILTITRDITDRKQNEAALMESEEQFKNLSNLLPQIVFEMDMKGKLTFANKNAFRTFEYTDDDFDYGLNAIDMIASADRERAAERMLQVLEGEESTSGNEYTAIKKDGTEFPVMVYSSRILRNGIPEGLRGIMVDISYRKIAEEQLRNSEQKYRAIFENVNEGILVARGNKLQLVNRAAEQILGYNAETLTSRNFTDFIHPDDRETVFERYKRRIAREDVETGYAFRIFTGSGEERWVEINSSLLEWDGQLSTINFIENATERIKAQEVLRESEEKFRSLVEQVGEMLFLHDLKGNVIDVNFAAVKNTGYSRDELKKMSVFDIDPDARNRDDIRVYWESLKIGDRPVRFEVRHRRKDSSIYPAEVSISKIVLRDGDYILGLARDIADQQAVLEALRESEALLNRSQEIAKTGSFIWNIKDDTLTWSKNMYAIHGLDEQSFAGNLTEISYKIIHPDDRDRVRMEIERMIESRRVWSMEFRIVLSDGRERIIRSNGEFELDPLGFPVKCFGVHQDITKQKQAEETLRENESILNTIGKMAKIGGWELYPETMEVTWTDETYRIHELPKSIKPPLEDAINFWHPEDQPILRKSIQQALDKGIPYELELRFITAKGRNLYARTKCNPIVRNGKVIKLQGFFQDITDRKRAEKDLMESEARFKALHNASFGGIAIHDQGVILESNQGLSDISGFSYDELIGMDGLLLIAEKSRETVMNNIRSGYERPYKAFGVRKNGEEYHLRLEARNIPYKGKKVRVVEFRDITEQIRAEEEREKLKEQLIQAQKIESVGRLAGGVAHDFNNMLGVILGHTEMALEQVAYTEPLRADLEEIQKAAQRSADITRQLLAFARKQTIAPQVIDLNEAVNSALKMIERLIGEDMDLVWVPEDKNLWPIKMDPSQIDQILANLCVNARDAIADVGKITIETGRASFDDAYCADHPGFVTGDFVLLAVSDDGCGMDKETMANLFEPFFTTKDVDKGTGLGLATVYGIVKQNNGFVNVYSEPGQGTTFKIYLPRHEAKTARETGKHPPRAMGRGRETILLVEDEPSILRMTRMMLERIGYKVLAAGAPGEAMALAREHAGEIHLLMTDVVMPEMNGRELARNLLSLYPNIKRLFMSGYTANVIAHHGVLEPGVQFIQKPFAKDKLATKVREALEES